MIKKNLRSTWLPIRLSRKVRKGKMYTDQVFGIPVIVLRDSAGAAHCLLDRCPHRYSALSLGKFKGDVLECINHGWCFSPQGECTSTPTLSVDKRIPAGANIPRIPVQETDGYIWCWFGKPSLAKTTPLYSPSFFLGSANSETCTRFQKTVPYYFPNLMEDALDFEHFHIGKLHRLFNSPLKHTQMSTSIKEGMYCLDGKLASTGGRIDIRFQYLSPILTIVKLLRDEHLIFSMIAYLLPVSHDESRLQACVYRTGYGKTQNFPGFLLSFLARRLFEEDIPFVKSRIENQKRSIKKQSAYSKQDRYLVKYHQWSEQYFEMDDVIVENLDIALADEPSQEAQQPA